jgi:hypothetical protein
LAAMGGEGEKRGHRVCTGVEGQYCYGLRQYMVQYCHGLSQYRMQYCHTRQYRLESFYWRGAGGISHDVSMQLCPRRGGQSARSAEGVNV